jgi:hypothetical protein
MYYSAPLRRTLPFFYYHKPNCVPSGPVVRYHTSTYVRTQASCWCRRCRVAVASVARQIYAARRRTARRGAVVPSCMSQQLHCALSFSARRDSGRRSPPDVCSDPELLARPRALPEEL